MKTRARTWTLGTVVLIAAAVVCAWAACGCGDDEEEAGAPGAAGGAATGTEGMTLSSSAFGHNEAIPEKYAFRGDDDVSPPLTWSNVPAEAKSLVLIVDDPDAHGFAHWLVYNIPPSAKALKEGIPQGDLSEPAGAKQGSSDGPGVDRYTGMDPPPGETHHYHFTLYALDTVINVGPGPDKEKLGHMIEGHVLAKTTLIGTYRK